MRDAVRVPDLDALRAEALAAVERYADAAFEARADFVPGETQVSVAGKVIGAPELRALVDAALDGWLTEGRYATDSAPGSPSVTERPHVALVGSGSQANLLAVAAARLAPPRAPAAARRRGDHARVGFPTTVAPLYQHGLGRSTSTSSPTPTTRRSRRSPTRSARARAAILAAHCLGNPFDAAGLEALCREHDLVLIEDCCDALGSRIGGRLAGTFGAGRDLLVLPRPPHDDGGGRRGRQRRPDWARAVGSLREWGRDCWCPPGVDDVCGRRFDGRFGALPAGYDHKYVFSHVGYNLKVTDMQAALGVAQTHRLESFAARRRENFDRLHAALQPLEEHVVLPRALPEAEPIGSDIR